ncbi:rbcL, partial [Symbiodinium sp. CCMP2456]
MWSSRQVIVRSLSQTPDAFWQCSPDELRLRPSACSQHFDRVVVCVSPAEQASEQASFSREDLPVLWRIMAQDPPRLADAVLALWPPSGTSQGPGPDYMDFAESVLPHLADLMDITSAPPHPHEVVSASRGLLRAKVSLFVHSAKPEVNGGPPLSVAAAYLRRRLTLSPEMSGETLTGLLMALRTLGPGLPGPGLLAQLRGLLGIPGARDPLPKNLGVMWLLLQAAAYFVSHRLKSPFGSATSSLQLLETIINESSAKVAQKISENLARATPTTGVLP